MQRFTYDLLHDVTEDTEETYEQELISRRTIPAFATDDQRKQLMLWMVDAIDDVTLTVMTGLETISMGVSQQ